MELEELRSSWKNSGRQNKNLTELQRMTEFSNHPKLKRIRNRFLVESILLTAFLLLYYNMFDGHQKTVTMNIMLIMASLAYLIGDISGLIIVTRPVQGSSLLVSLKTFQKKLVRMMYISISTSFVFGLSIILYMSSGIVFTLQRSMILLGMVCTLIVILLFSYKKWQKLVHEIRLIMSGFER